MEKDLAIKELKSAKQYALAIRLTNERITRLWSRIVGSGVAQYGDAVHSTAPKETGDLFDKKNELEWTLHSLSIEYSQTALDISRKINNVGQIDMRLANVLSLYYIDQRYMSEVAKELGYSLQQIKRLKSSAIEVYCSVNK